MYKLKSITTAGHVNPEKPILAKIGTVYPQPVQWCCLWGFKAYYCKYITTRKKKLTKGLY